MDILSGEVAAPDDVKFRFAFMAKEKVAFPWLKFKDLVFSKQDMLTLAQEIVAKAGRELTESEKQKVSKHVSLVFKSFHSDDGVGYVQVQAV